RDQTRRLEELLDTERATVARLQELNRLQSGFVDVTSHELRTPLTSIAGYAKMLRRPEYWSDASSRDEFLEAVERQTDRLSRLVENLLAASQMEGDALRVQVGPVSFQRTASAILGRFG